VLGQGLGFAVLFTYISGSSFVLQSGYGLSAQQFSLVFAGNGVGIVLAGQLSRLLVRRVGARSLLRTGLAVEALGSALLVTAALAGWGLSVVLGALWVVVSANGLVLPNATALAMADAARMAGTASALVGVSQFAIAGLGAPLAGLGPAGELLPMAMVMVSFAVLGLLAAALLPGRAARPRVDQPAATARA
jgi:DHA1 family bicyclomycin/chloramphenicol resistance-like MFS transporter